MEGSEVPTAAWVAFAITWVSGLSLFGCVFAITRKLGMSWNRRLGGANLETADVSRLGKLVFGIEPAPGIQVRRLLWAVRGLWALMLASIVVFMVILSRVA